MTLLSLLLMFSPLYCFAAGVADYDYSRFSPSARIYSFGDYLTEEEQATLEEAAVQLESTAGITVAFIITDDLDGAVEEFSDAVFLKSSLGEAYNENFLLLSVDMTGRTVDLYTHGKAQQEISDSMVDYVLDEIAVPNLRNQDYYNLVNNYLNWTDEMLGAGRGDAGTVSPDSQSVPNQYGVSSAGASGEADSGELVTGILIAWFFAAVVTVIFLAYQYAQHRSVSRASGARQYMKPGSFVLTTDKDYFLRTVTTKTEIPKNNQSSSSSSRSRGGSSHSHSSGHSHGGGSRKF